jgi:hypothetical protein
MKARTCFVQVWISNDKGENACYSLRPVPSEELLGSSVAGFFLTNLSSDQTPVYAVLVAFNGTVTCNCCQFTLHARCKHADALVAADVLPVGLIDALRGRTELLNHAEAEVLRLADAANEERQLHDHDCEWRSNRIADLNEQLERLEAELEARQPKKRGRPRKVAA